MAWLDADGEQLDSTSKDLPKVRNVVVFLEIGMCLLVLQLAIERRL